MLHILWLVIKCIGIVLVFLLAVILLAVALVLFCPVRYRGRAIRDADKWEISGRAGWLLGLVSVRIAGGSEGSRVQIRLLGIDTAVWKKLFFRKKTARKKTAKGTKARAQSGSGEEKMPYDRELAAEPEARELKPEAAGNFSERTEAEIAEDAPPMPFKKSRENFLKRFWRNLVEKCQSICEGVKKMMTALRNLCSTVTVWKEFLGRGETKAAFGRTWQQILALLRHAGPQKIKGWVDLGLGSPAATGQLLAVLGASYPIHRSCLTVNPVWDRKVLEGNVQMRGRVYGAALLYAACRLYFDKNVKTTLRWMMQQAG